MENDIVGLKAGDAGLVLGIDISENSIFALYHKLVKTIHYSTIDVGSRSTHRRNLLGNLNLLDKLLVSLQRTSEIRIALNLLTQIGLHIHQSDQTIFDLEMDLGSLFNGFVEYTFCFDGEDFATIEHQIKLARRHGISGSV
jgi:hypothetical protein